MKKLITIAGFLALFAGQAHAVSSIRPYSRPVPPHHNHVIIHEHKPDVLPYVFIGIVAGVIIHELAVPRCQTGIICKKF